MVLILLLHVYYMCVRLIVHVHIIWHAMSDVWYICAVCVLLTTHILILILHVAPYCRHVWCVHSPLLYLYHWVPSIKKGEVSNFFRSFTAYLLTSVAAVVPTVYETKHLSTSSCSYQLLLLLLSYEKEHGLCNWSIIFWVVDVVRVWM